MFSSVLVLLVILMSSPVWAANTHNTRSEADERAAWFSDFFRPWVVEGCLPTVPAPPGLTLTVPACRAYVRSAAGTQLTYVQQDAASVGALNGGDGTYWLLLHASSTASVLGWTRQAGSHLAWQVAPVQPLPPAGSLLVARVTVSGGAITAVADLRTLSPTGGPLDVVQAGLDNTGLTDIVPQLTVLAANAGTKPLYFPPGRYKIGSSFAVPSGLHLQGSGWTYVALQPASLTGTVFVIDDDSFVPFDFSAGSMGVTIERVGFEYVQPTPAPGWAPTAYPPTLKLDGFHGDVRLRDLMFWNSTWWMDLGQTATFGRVYVDDVSGQILSKGIVVDSMLDCSTFRNIQMWPFWSENANVVSYATENGQGFVLGRADCLRMDTVFGIDLATLLHFQASATYANTGSSAQLSNIMTNTRHYAIVVDGAAAHTLQFTNLGCYGDEVCLFLNGSVASNVVVGNLYCFAMGINCVIASGTDPAANTVQIGSLVVNTWNTTTPVPLQPALNAAQVGDAIRITGAAEFLNGNGGAACGGLGTLVGCPAP